MSAGEGQGTGARAARRDMRFGVQGSSEVAPAGPAAHAGVALTQGSSHCGEAGGGAVGRGEAGVGPC
jgi:hypothetical protein